jgi:guanylate kinase
MQSGKLIVISAPSGSGKTTIAKEIMKRFPDLGFSVSGTTRARRADEVDGRDYFFLTKEEFKRRIDGGEFVEWEELYGDCYGTLKSEVDRVLGSRHHLLFDVDVKGGLSIKKHYPNALLIFIRPPSVEALKDRLLKRQTEDDVTLQRRLDRVTMELELGNKFDHQVVNDELDRAIREVQSVIEQHFAT